MQLNLGPIQYQKGWTEFFKLKFKLTPDVLIPRPETELLVEEVINFCKSYSVMLNSFQHLDTQIPKQVRDDNLTIADIGTGSGCIAISLAKNLPARNATHSVAGGSNAKIIAIDVSEKALEVAKKNAKFHKVDKRILFLENDLLTNVKVMPDIIAANLPYIPTFKLMYLDPLVREYEPKLALDGGSDGLELYRKLFQQIAHFTRPPQGWQQGWQHDVIASEKSPVDFSTKQLPESRAPRLIICEIDEDQGDLTKQEAKKYFPNAEIEIKKDLAKKDRFLVIKS